MRRAGRHRERDAARPGSDGERAPRQIMPDEVVLGQRLRRKRHRDRRIVQRDEARTGAARHRRLIEPEIRELQADVDEIISSHQQKLDHDVAPLSSSGEILPRRRAWPVPIGLRCSPIRPRNTRRRLSSSASASTHICRKSANAGSHRKPDCLAGRGGFEPPHGRTPLRSRTAS